MTADALENILTEVDHNRHGVGDCLIEIEVYSADNHFVTKRRFRNQTELAKRWVSMKGKNHQKFTLTIK